MATSLRRRHPVGSAPSKEEEHNTSNGKDGAAALAGWSDRQEQEQPSLAAMDRAMWRASWGTLLAWGVLVALAYGTTPPSSYERLQGWEKWSAAIAFGAMSLSGVAHMLPLLWSSLRPRGVFAEESTSPHMPSHRVSGVLMGGLVTQGVAICTNGAMAFYDVPILIDPVLAGKRVSVLRWAEFATLAFLMTFLTEAFGVHHTSHNNNNNNKPTKGITSLFSNIPLTHALCQGLSTLLGMLFPFAPDARAWYTLLAISCSLFAVIFPRLLHKQAVFRTLKPGRTVREAVLYDRTRLSLKMLQACTIIWALFPIVFFVSGFILPYCLPPTSVLRDPALPMICEALLDILSKLVQMNIIMDVHNGVFDDQDGARALQRLDEVKEAIGEKWLTANDVVIISVRQEFSGTVTFMVSPSTALIPSKQQQTHGMDKQPEVSLVCSLGYKHFQNDSGDDDDDDKSSANHSVRPSILSGEGADMRRLSALAGLVVRSWKAKALPRATLSHNVEKVQCDAEITRLEEHLLVVVVRGLVVAD
jgi:hypothetical protein